MSRTCSTCGRAWDRRASFCGGCGDLLVDDLGTVSSTTAGTRRWWQHPAARLGAVAVVVGAAVAAVPQLSIERTPPVDGEIGVPETDDLRAAPASDVQPPRPDAPPVSCDVGGDPVDCVTWSRPLLTPAGAENGGGWAIGAGDHVLLLGNHAIEVVDADDGTRLWRSEELAGAFPLDVGDGRVILHGPQGLAALSMATGDVLWEAPELHARGDGMTAEGVLVLQGPQGSDSATMVGVDAADGTERWRRSFDWPAFVVGSLDGGRVMLEEASPDPDRLVVDVATGEVVTRIQIDAEWMFDASGPIAVFVRQARPDPGGPNPAGDGGATLVGVDTTDGTTRWSRDVPAGQVEFGRLDDLVLAPSTDRLLAIDATTGEVRWETDLSGSLDVGSHVTGGWFGPRWNEGGRSPVAVVHDQVDGLVRALDPADASVRWERVIEDGVDGVLATGDHVMVHSGGGSVTFLDPEDGTVTHRVDAPRQHTAGWDPLLVVHAPSGQVTRLDVPGATVP